MPRRTTGALQHTRTGLCLRTAMPALTDKERKAALQALRETDVGGAAKIHCSTVRAVVNTFIPAAGGSGAKARMPLNQLATSIFADDTTGHVDSLTTNNVVSIMHAMRADSRPNEGQTARRVLAAACRPANKDPKHKGLKGVSHLSASCVVLVCTVLLKTTNNTSSE